MNTARIEKVFPGLGVSSGIVFGQALKLDSRHRVILKLFIDEAGLDSEIQRLELAFQASRLQLEILKERLAKKLGSEHGFILDVHLLMLEDTSLISEIINTIRTKHANAEWALRHVAQKIMNAYASLEEEYFRDRRVEIENVVERVLFNLTGDRLFSWTDVPENVIILSHDFNPSAFAIMDLQKVHGLALESGARTSHTAIIARSLRMPAVMGIGDFLHAVNSGDLLLLDGDEGQLVMHPTAERLDKVRGRLEQYIAVAGSSENPTGEPALTADGLALTLRANTDLPHEVKAARQFGADGIGLFRTEFMFLAHPHGFPGMEAQRETYAFLAREMAPHPVSIRTLDSAQEVIKAGGEAGGSSLNPSMGLRGVRWSLAEPELFCTQIEAILRASQAGNVEIVLPLVTTVDEIRQAKALIGRVRDRISLNTPLAAVPLGAMIEVPSAVLCLESIAAEVDFICVGTNDLIQYLLAVDRGNPQVSYLYQPLHPSILQCLSRISAVSRSLKKPVRLCGEMSSNPFFVILLLGMGYCDLSMNAYSIPTVRKVIREVSMERAAEIASRAMRCASAQEAGQFLVDAVMNEVRTDLTPYTKEILAPYDRERGIQGHQPSA